MVEPLEPSAPDQKTAPELLSSRLAYTPARTASDRLHEASARADRQWDPGTFKVLGTDGFEPQRRAVRKNSSASLKWTATGSHTPRYRRWVNPVILKHQGMTRRAQDLRYRPPRNQPAG